MSNFQCPKSIHNCGRIEVTVERWEIRLSVTRTTNSLPVEVKCYIGVSESRATKLRRLNWNTYIDFCPSTTHWLPYQLELFNYFTIMQSLYFRINQILQIFSVHRQMISTVNLSFWRTNGKPGSHLPGSILLSGFWRRYLIYHLTLECCDMKVNSTSSSP